MAKREERTKNICQYGLIVKMYDHHKCFILVWLDTDYFHRVSSFVLPFFPKDYFIYHLGYSTSAILPSHCFTNLSRVQKLLSIHSSIAFPHVKSFLFGWALKDFLALNTICPSNWSPLKQTESCWKTLLSCDNSRLLQMFEVSSPFHCVTHLFLINKYDKNFFLYICSCWILFLNNCIYCTSVTVLVQSC